MPNKIKPELLSLLTPSAEKLNILVVESVSYLVNLREKFPQAKIFLVAAESDAIDNFKDIVDEFHAVNYIEERLPFAAETFDYIIADLLLEQAGHPQDIAAGFSRFLKETGSLLTSFRNIRHWSVLEELRDGHYYSVVTRLFAREEFERLLYASFYKMVHITPQKRPNDKISAEFIAAGFANIHDDLNTEFWLVKADRSMPEMALLKSMYTKEIRKELAVLLHRIEYEIDALKTCNEFWHFYQEKMLFPDYMAAFIKQAVFHGERFYKILLKNSPNNQTNILAMLQSARDNAITAKEMLYLDELIAGFNTK